MDFEKYTNKMEYPRKPERPKLAREHNAEQAYDYSLSLGVYENARATWRVAYQEYRAENRRLETEFKQDAFDELGISENPKREKAWDLAWSHGHSAGWNEVWNYLVDFAELIK